MGLRPLVPGSLPEPTGSAGAHTRAPSSVNYVGYVSRGAQRFRYVTDTAQSHPLVVRPLVIVEALALAKLSWYRRFRHEHHAVFLF